MLEESFKVTPPPELDMREPLPLDSHCGYYGSKCIEDNPSSWSYELYDIVYWWYSLLSGYALLC